MSGSIFGLILGLILALSGGLRNKLVGLLMLALSLGAIVRLAPIFHRFEQKSSEAF